MNNDDRISVLKSDYHGGEEKELSVENRRGLMAYSSHPRYK